MLEQPCAHLTPMEPPTCQLGRQVPAECRQACAGYRPGLRDDERTVCEVWSRVMGYHRPISAFNAGKQSEHAERRLFRER